MEGMTEEPIGDQPAPPRRLRRGCLVLVAVVLALAIYLGVRLYLHGWAGDRLVARGYIVDGYPIFLWPQIKNPGVSPGVPVDRAVFYEKGDLDALKGFWGAHCLEIVGKRFDDAELERLSHTCLASSLSTLQLRSSALTSLAPLGRFPSLSFAIIYGDEALVDCGSIEGVSRPLEIILANCPNVKPSQPESKLVTISIRPPSEWKVPAESGERESTEPKE